MEDRMKSGPARGSRSRGAVAPSSTLPEALVRACEAARHGTYFDCLGIGTDASTTEVREAYLKHVGELDVMRSMTKNDSEATAAVDEASRIAGDAFAVLSDPDLRLTYRRALLPAEGREPWRS